MTINFKSHSGITTLTAKQKFRTSASEVWNFVSRPENLEKITPDYMGFKITSEPPTKMYAGLIITYKVSPFPFWRASWVTEITQIKDREYFIDEQRFGPYAMWHHEHIIEPTEGGGCNMIDKISYKPPFGIFGRIANSILIKKQLRGIFNYRKIVMEQLFN